MFQSKIDETIPMPSFCRNRLYFSAVKQVYVCFRGEWRRLSNEFNHVFQKWPNNMGFKSKYDRKVGVGLQRLGVRTYSCRQGCALVTGNSISTFLLY